MFRTLRVTSLWNYFYNRIPRIIMYAINDVQQRVFVHCVFPVFIIDPKIYFCKFFFVKYELK